MYQKLCLVLFCRRYILFLIINIGIKVFVSVTLKKTKILYPYLFALFKIPKGCSFNSYKIRDYINIVEITSTQHYTRLAQNKLLQQKMYENDRKETVSKVLTSIRLRNGIERFTWKTHRYFVGFENRIHVEISTSNRCHNFHVDSPFKIDEILTNFPRRVSAFNRW